MRVVHLSTGDFGGAAIAAINLHEALLEQGIGSDLLTLGRTRSDVPRHRVAEPFALHPPAWLSRARYKARRALEAAGIADDRSPGPGNRNLRDRPPGREFFSLPYSFFDIDRHPLVRQADIVHLHWVSQGMIGFDRFFARCRKPIAWTLHDMNPFTGGCHHADECEGYVTDCTGCPQLADPSKAHAYWRVKRDALRTVPRERMRFVAPSAWLAGRARRSSILAGRECTVIPNGFDRRHFRFIPKAEARSALGLCDDRRIVLFSAFDAANPRKGMPLLLDALDGIAGVRLLSMGRPMPDLNGRPDVLSTGLLTDPGRIALHYAAADLFVLPSQAENLPNTICEALLCGTPVAAFRVGGIPEQVNAGNGLLAEPGDAHGLREALRAALSGAWDHEAIAAAAAARYDRDSVARAYAQLYRALQG